MSEWKEYRLGELATVIPGYAFKGKDFGENGCRVVKIGDIAPPIVDVVNCLRTQHHLALMTHSSTWTFHSLHSVYLSGRP